MARTTLTVQDAPGGYDADGAALTFAAGDATNGNDYVATGRELLIARNTDGATAYSVTVKSVADAALGNRTGDLTFSIPANGFRMFGPIPTVGFLQGNGRVNIDVQNAAVQLAVIRLPR